MWVSLLAHLSHLCLYIEYRTLDNSINPNWPHSSIKLELWSEGFSRLRLTISTKYHTLIKIIHERRECPVCFKSCRSILDFFFRFQEQPLSCWGEAFDSACLYFSCQAYKCSLVGFTSKDRNSFSSPRARPCISRRLNLTSWAQLIVEAVALDQELDAYLIIYYEKGKGFFYRFRGE